MSARPPASPAGQQHDHQPDSHITQPRGLDDAMGSVSAATHPLAAEP